MSTAAAQIEERMPATFKVAQPTRHIDALRPHPDNPREEIDREDPKIVEMSRSIELHGIIEPLVITPAGDIIAGHRRRVATRLAAERSRRPELLYVPVVIRDVAPEAVLELMLQENMQRESLNLVEEARAMRGIIDRKKLTLADLAREIALPPNEISPRLAILKCEEAVQRLFASNQLPLSAAPWLAQCDLAEQQINYAGMLARRQITLKKLQEEMREASYKERNKKPAVAGTPTTRTSGAESQSRPAASVKSSKEQLGDGRTPLPSRAEAMSSLQKAMGRGKRSITLFNFKLAVESICCACGMVGQEDICRSCPFARIILGVAGRAD